MPLSLPTRVRLVEVGPRDGLQNEPQFVPTAAKLAFIRALANAGLTEIEATAFVHPARVPQMADAAEVAAGLSTIAGARFSALVPNRRGLERALAAGFRRVAVFTAASESFTQRNIGMTIAASLAEFRGVAREALAAGASVRGYISTAFHCPFEGRVLPDRVVPLIAALQELGADEVSIGDTIGTAVPTEVVTLIGAARRVVPLDLLACHFHDTSGTALANVLAALNEGVTVFDSSAGGLGGCPFAPGAAGNLATEDLCYLLDGMGVQTGVSLPALVSASTLLQAATARAPASRVFRRIVGASTPEAT